MKYERIWKKTERNKTVNYRKFGKKFQKNVRKV